MRKTTSVASALAGIALLLANSAALAVPVGFTVHGVITDADAGNAFGLDVGDLVTASGVFDSDQVDDTDPAFAFVGFGLGTGNTMTVVLGAITLNETNDVDFLDGLFPTLVTSFGDFLGIDLIAEIGVNGAPVDFGSFDLFDGFDADGAFIEGEWIVDSFKARVLPEPASLSIFGLGLVLIGLLRRRRFGR